MNPRPSWLDDLEKLRKNDEVRYKTFKMNQQAISDIAKGSASLIGNLQIKPNINGVTDLLAAPQPLKVSESFEIDLNKLPLPSQCGKGTLRDAIQRVCQENQVLIDDKMSAATFTSVVTALAGQYAEDSADFSQATQAEFVPVFNSLLEEKRALVLCYSLNGETKLRVDDLQGRGSMACLGRESGSSDALQAIEIPNLFAAEMKEGAPNLFSQLQKNAYIVAFVEYDLIHTASVASSSNLLATKPLPVMRSIVLDGASSSVAHHDNTQRKLKKIHVYAIGAMVINTHQRTLTPAESAHISSVMQARANELNSLYFPYMTYQYRHFSDDIGKHLQKYNVIWQHSDILEHAILGLGSVADAPTRCSTYQHPKDSQYFLINFGLSFVAVHKLVTNLQRILGHDFCQMTEFEQKDESQMVRFSLDCVAKNIDLIKKQIDTILSDPRHLLAYQKYSRQEQPYSSITNHFNKIMAEFGMNTRTNCVEIVLLKMFGCSEELHAASFQPGATYIDRMVATSFFFDISEAAAKQVVDRLNHKFPLQARFMCANARLVDYGARIFSEISIENRLLTSPAFLSLFKDALNLLVENDPLLVERLRIQSGTQEKSSQDYANILTSLAKSYQGSEEASQPGEFNPKLPLSEALLKFSAVIAKPQSKKSERFAASDGVRRAVAFFESTQTGAENELFKKADKKVIKEVQKVLGLRR